ncbi:hypothetical protein JNJ66_01915 [Candidatus Saccharibacteria bacterium]|nr:hypothetical protein [Candidatus Saccharibacteria bacterium]
MNVLKHKTGEVTIAQGLAASIVSVFVLQYALQAGFYLFDLAASLLQSAVNFDDQFIRMQIFNKVLAYAVVPVLYFLIAYTLHAKTADKRKRLFTSFLIAIVGIVSADILYTYGSLLVSTEYLAGEPSRSILADVAFTVGPLVAYSLILSSLRYTKTWQ